MRRYLASLVQRDHGRDNTELESLPRRGNQKNLPFGAVSLTVGRVSFIYFCPCIRAGIRLANNVNNVTRTSYSYVRDDLSDQTHPAWHRCAILPRFGSCSFSSCVRRDMTTDFSMVWCVLVRTHTRYYMTGPRVQRPSQAEAWQRQSRGCWLR